MKRFILLFISLAVIGVQLAFAQSFIVKGQVTSDDGKEPLIGASILQEGTGNGVITDIDGNFSIEIKGASKATLKFSYIGLQAQQHVVTAQTKVLNVVMKADAQVMDEVVVVAYGVRKKGTIAGSVSTVKAEKMESVPAAGFGDRLRDFRLCLLPANQVERLLSRFVERTLLAPELLLYIFWMGYLLLLVTLIQSVRVTLRVFLY